MEATRERYDELCRLCASYDAVKMDIFGQEGNNRQLVDKIQTCLPFKIVEDDRLPKCICYRCMYNLENFYDFRTACVNAVALLERCLPEEVRTEIKQESVEAVEPYSELRMELLKGKDSVPMLMPEAPVVNPNAALGTPPRFKSDGEPETELDELAVRSGLPDQRLEELEEYEMDMETNPSDFLEMSALVPEEEQHHYQQRHRQQQQPRFRGEQHEVYVCSLCNKAFSSKGHLSLHARIHVGAGDVIGEKVITDDHTSYKRPYQCDLCNKSYSTAKHRWGHVSTTHRGHPAVTCGYCSRIYSTRTNLEEHIKSRHAGLPPPSDAPTPFTHQDSRFHCKTCPKMYTTVSDLNKHSKICLAEQQRKDLANSGFAPPKIGKVKNALDPTSDMSSLDSDNENRDYKSVEAKLAKNPQLTILKQALIKGESVKKEYEERQKMLSKAKKQQVNSFNKEIGPDTKRWYCEICPVNFATLDQLKEHEKTHDADKPYICILCEKDFVLKSSLSRHIISSHGVDPTPLIESDKCLKQSVKEANIQTPLIKEEHNATKENSISPYSLDNIENEEDEHENGNENMLEIETVFVCEICTRDFNDRASLWLHIRATHKEYAAFACGVCLKICSDNAQLLNHVNMYHGGSKLLISEQRRYSCTICGRQHDSRKKLITHVSIHNIDPGYDPASFVQLNTNYFNESVNSINSNEGNELIMDCDEEGEKVDCYMCCKAFPNEDQLIRHQRNAHKTEQMVPMGEFGNGASGQNGTMNRAQYHLFFVCEICGSSHPSKWERWLHISNMHGNESTIRCEREDCGKIFATKTLRNEHAQHHHLQGSSPNTCEICGKLWGSRVDYWKHVMGVHSDTVPLICGVCLKVFPDVLQLSQHVKLKHWPLTNGDFSCDICGRPYSNKSKMSRHRKIHGLDGEAYNPLANNSSLILNDASMTDDLSGGLPVPLHLDNGLPQPIEIASVELSCEICGDLKFLSVEDLSNHRRMTHNLFPCDLCNKCYGRTSHLWKHVNRVHKGHEDVTCRYCLKTSASRDHLAAHIAKIHRYEPDVKSDFREIMNYKSSCNSGGSAAISIDAVSAASEEDGLHFCEKCNKTFHKRYLLRRHMKGCQNYRKDPGALLTRCRACERIFKDRASLQKHIENHHSSYECHLCKETITSKLGIMTHNRMHHMHHPDLTCELESCRKLFRTKEDLESHRKDHKHHGIPNVCDFCGDTVENKLKLKMHVLSLHRNEIGVSCGVCLIPMKDPKDLKKHVEDAHESILRRPNTCQVCGKQYASKWKAFDHTKKCHGKVFRTCKQCLAVFTSDEELRGHYEHVHNIPKDQLDAYQYRLEVSGHKMDDYDLGPLEVVVKEEPEEIDLDCSVDPYDECSSDSKRRRSLTDTFDCEICPEMFLNGELLSIHYRNVHNTDPARMFKRLKLDPDAPALTVRPNDGAPELSSIKPLKKMRDRENYECSNCQKQFCTKTLYLSHVSACTRKAAVPILASGSGSILEAHLKAAGAAAAASNAPSATVAPMISQLKRELEVPEPGLCETNLNIPDFNLFEDINLQLSGQKPVPSLMPLGHGGGHKGASSGKYSRKDSRKVYDETTNTECACEVCGKQWPAKKHLWQHLIRFHRAEAAVTCGVCLKLCATYEDLSEHLRHTHPAILSTAGNNFTCKVCGRYHNARSKLLLHMSIHINCKASLVCRRCGRSFDTEDRLREHAAAGPCLATRAGQAPIVDGELIIKEESQEKGSLIGDEEEDDDNDDEGDEGDVAEGEVEANEYESEEENERVVDDDGGDDDEDNSDNSDSTSDDSDSSDSGSNSDTSSDDDSDDSSNDSKDSENDEDNDESAQVTGVAAKREIAEQNETMSLGNDEGLSGGSEDESYLESKLEPAEHELEDQYHEMPDKNAMLNYSEDEEGGPPLSPMIPMAMKEPGAMHMDDSQDELRRSLAAEALASVANAVAVAGNVGSDVESEDEQLSRAQLVDPNSAFHDDNSRSSNQGDEEQEADEEHEMTVQEEVIGHELPSEEQEEQVVEEEEVLEVDENDMHNLNGTVLMLANDADGNQILIERNMADLENDDSVHDMAQYVFQDGTGFALEDYEAIVESQGDRDDEERHGFQMEMGHHHEEQVIQQEEENVEHRDEIGELDELDEEEVQEEGQEYENELISSAKS